MLVTLAVALVPAFIFAPGPLAENMSGNHFTGQRELVDNLSTSFVDYWRSGGRNLTPGLDRLVDYWLDFHVVKAAISAALLVVLITLGALLTKAFLRSGGFGLASTGVVVGALALVALLGLMANLQGAVAPLSSMLSMLPMRGSGGDLAGTLEQVRQGLADYPNSGGRTPAVGVMVHDFALYHAEMAVTGILLGVFSVVMTVMSWKRAAKAEASDRRTKRVFRSFGLFSVLLSLAFVVLVVANVGTAANAAPPLKAFFEGGW